MAIIDAFTLFSGTLSNGVITGQTVTGTNTSVVSTNSIDTQAGLTLNTGGQSVDLGKGQEFDLQFNVTTAFAGLTSLELQYVSADDAALTTNVTVLGSSGAILLADLGAGKQHNLAVPKADPRTVRRYVGCRYVIVGAGSAGAIAAGFTTISGDLPQPAFKSGFAIS